MNQSNKGSQIKSIRITNLFGNIPEHYVELKDGGITFIHGPNGCGKTTFLKLIDAVFNWNLATLRDTEFETIRFEINNNDVLLVYKQFIAETRRPSHIIFQLNEEKCSVDVKPENLRTTIFEIEENVPGLVKLSPQEWYDRNLNIQMDRAEVMRRYAFRSGYKNEDISSQLRALIDSVGLHFIKTQRLLKIENTNYRRGRSGEIFDSNVIQAYSDEIRTQINAKLAHQANVAQQKDRTFPKRLLSLRLDKAEPETVIRTRYSDSESKIQKLMNAGLIESQENIKLPLKKLQETERKVLTLYLEDTKEKLAVFDDLQEKIETLLEIINTKFRSKRLSVNREKGFCIHMIKDQVDVELSPTQLSSGEQHQIVLFYELIFKSSENTFFLIDEPEISLHIDWQRMFIEDLKKIAKLGNRQFLIATHSPQIIGNNRDLAVALEDGILD